MSIHVFIADDHAVIADGISMHCSNSEAFTFAGRADSLELLHERMDQRVDKINVLLLDTFGPDRQFLQDVNELCEKYPSLAVVILTMNDNINFAQALIDRGARGFLHKTLGLRDIFSSIAEVHNYPDRRVIRIPIGGEPDSDREEVNKLLTPREKQVIALMCRGFKNNEEMAKILTSINRQEILATTIQTHRRNIRSKLRDYGITNDTSLGYWIGKWDLLDGNELSSIDDE